MAMVGKRKRKEKKMGERSFLGGAVGVVRRTHSMHELEVEAKEVSSVRG